MATIAKQTIYLNLRPGSVMPVLHVSQGDSGLEALEFKLINRSQPWPIPAAVTDIQLNGTTPVGVFSYSDPTWSGNTVTANVTETMTAERGLTLCELRLLDSTLNSIGTLNFVIAVEPSPFTNAHVSTSDMAVITESLNGSQRNMLLSKSWAVGDTGMRDGEDTNNSKYWSEVSDDNGQRWATGTVDGAAVPSTDPAYHNNSKHWSEQSDINGERWSVGKINGTDVPSSDETYHNNSKWWSSISESWAVGGTNNRTGENTNNSKYWSEVSHQYANEVSYKKVYENVAEMKADADLLDGQVCRTLGYYVANDGGGALYQMHTTQPTTYSEGITNGLYAELILPEEVTPEMFGAKGDGVTDDTAAFRALAAAQNVSIVISDKTYLVTESVTLSGTVISDQGTYPNYIPEYAKPLNLNLTGLAYGDDILLPVDKSYAESITYIDGKYYVMAMDYSTSPEKNYIAVYDNDMTYQSMTYTDAVYGLSNNSCTDGTYLYVDFDNGYHCKYDPADLSSAVYAKQNTGVRNVEYYNHQLYAIVINANSVSVSHIDETLTTLSDTWTINTERQVLQSVTIYNGQLYIPTTIGVFKLIDLVSHEILEIPYQWLKEIEKFYTAPDGSLAVMGHLYGFDGIFNIGALNGGVDADIVNYIPLDGSKGHISVTRKYRSNIYSVKNGLQAGFPMDDCDAIIFDHVMVAIDRNTNSIYTYIGGKWLYVGPTAPTNIIINSGLYISYDAGGGFTIFTNGYRLTSASAVIDYDFSAIYDRCGLSDERTFTAFALSRQYGVWFGNADIYCIQLSLSKSSLQLDCRNLTNPSNGINCNGVFRVKLY